jgi:cysteinyl-tRNA synthetase
MSIFIYNSLKREKQEFIPLDPKGKEVKMYVCGPTVYDQPHIGHARSAYIFDVIRRYLIYRGYKVKFVRNVTDVDDKIIDKAQKEFKDEDLNTAVGKVSTKYLDLYHEDMKSLGILEPDFEPKATEYVSAERPLMQKFISQLIGRGCAYVSGGDVYFNIKKAKGYGKLSNQAIEKMESGARIAFGEKKNDPLDFALWKSAKPGEPAWDSPWGKGRPGWHIECSVMSLDILGDEFDIHGGGIDLIFPHHENEIAQSEAAGKKFAKYWIHHGLLTINTQKMSKSLGNFIEIRSVLKEFPDAHASDILKVFFLGTHYSNPIDYSEEVMREAKKEIYRFSKAAEPLKNVAEEETDLDSKNRDYIDGIKKSFDAAMDNDFNMPQAWAKLNELVRYCNRLEDRWKSGQHYLFSSIQYTKNTLCALAEVLGLILNPVNEHDPKWGEVSLLNVLTDALVKERINERLLFKVGKKYAEADAIRKELEAQGIILEDSKEGTTWRRKL